ncbi:MAG: hypothetical protein K1X79_00300 [Oligoflexia bacterium]|nr:hypothetical protein [Oligoflexia bacterium]
MSLFHDNSASRRSNSISLGAVPLAAIALSASSAKGAEPPSAQELNPAGITRPADANLGHDLASEFFNLQQPAPQAAQQPQTRPAAASSPSNLAAASTPNSQPTSSKQEPERSPWDSKTSSIILTITLTAAAFTIGKRIFVEIKNVVNDFRNWLLGRSTLSGSIDVLDFSRAEQQTFMEITAFGQINLKSLLEHAQAAKHFQRAAAMCTPKQPFVSLNYAAAARGFIWNLLRLGEGVLLTNDQIRKRFDREFREVYSARFAQEIKRRLAGYSDKREAHVLIPIVDRWDEQAIGRFGRKTTLERAELCFLVLRQRDFETYFSKPEVAEQLACSNERYRRRIEILQQAWKLDQEHRDRNTKQGYIDIQLPPAHPDYQFRLAAAIGLWPVIKVLEKSPKAPNGPTS